MPVIRSPKNNFLFIAALALAPAVTGCFLADGLDGGTKKHSGSPPQPALPPPPAPAGPTPNTLTGAALARRLSLDLLGQLPSPGDVKKLTDSPESFAALVDGYLASAASHRAIADLHPRMWRMNEQHLPDLEQFQAKGDVTLGAGLTDAARAEIVHEPALPVRYMLDQDEPFKNLFEHNYTIVHQDVADLWNLTSDGTPWAAEPYVFARYTDGRPDAGILASNGLLAAYPSESAAARRLRANRILHVMSCFRTEEKSAHLFADLTKDELKTDLVELAAKRAPCVGCHAAFHDQAEAFNGLPSGATFAVWRKYSAPAALAEGNVAGLAFDGLGGDGDHAPGLAKIIAEDPRTHRCEVERLAQEFYQRRLGSHDQTPVADALTFFYAGGGRILPAVRQLLQSPEYRFGPIPPNFTADYAQVSTGVKVLKRQQWQSVLAQLSPATANLIVPPELDPGVSESVTDTDRVPAGAYWHFADRLIRQAAEAITAAELADGVTAATRKVLTTLPDGDGKAATTAVVGTQIKDLWRLLTAQELADADKIYIDFMGLWSAAPPDGTADDFKRAWRMMLIAMMSHPRFLVY